MKVFVFREGKRYGPYSVGKLREFLLQGNFTVDDLVCLDGETWQKISEVPGLMLEEKPVALESSVEEEPQVASGSKAKRSTSRSGGRGSSRSRGIFRFDRRFEE